jgi:hypothetical protein
MKKLSLFTVSVSAALLGITVPTSLHWPSAKVPSLSLDTAEARLGRPLTPMSVAGVNRRANRRAAYAGGYYGGFRRGYYGAGLAAAGAVAAGAYYGGAYPAAAYGAYAQAPAYYESYPGPSYSGASYSGYAGGSMPPDAVIVNPVTGRWCTTEESGRQWCWTP